MNSSARIIEYPIRIFSAVHFTFLIAALLLALFFAILLSRKFGFTKKIIWVCAFIGLVCEMERMLFFVRETPSGYRLPANLIPFNLCPFQVVLIAILALSEAPEKHRKLISFMYPAMVGGGLMGMALCGEAFAAHGLSDLATYRYFLYHGMVVFMGFYLYLSKPFHFGLINYGYSLFLISCAGIMGIWINGFFGWDPEANHMFLVRPPVNGLPILNLDRGWPFYLLDIMMLSALLITLCYLPVIIRETPQLIRKIRGKPGG